MIIMNMNMNTEYGFTHMQPLSRIESCTGALAPWVRCACFLPAGRCTPNIAPHSQRTIVSFWGNTAVHGWPHSGQAKRCARRVVPAEDGVGLGAPRGELTGPGAAPLASGAPPPTDGEGAPSTHRRAASMRSERSSSSSPASLAAAMRASIARELPDGLRGRCVDAGVDCADAGVLWLISALRRRFSASTSAARRSAAAARAVACASASAPTALGGVWRMVAAADSHSGSSSLALCVSGGGGEGASSSAALLSQSGSSESCDSLPWSERGDASVGGEETVSGGVDTRLLKNIGGWPD